jgi:hypothetical protein
MQGFREKRASTRETGSDIILTRVLGSLECTQQLLQASPMLNLMGNLIPIPQDVWKCEVQLQADSILTRIL